MYFCSPPIASIIETTQSFRTMRVLTGFPATFRVRTPSKMPVLLLQEHFLFIYLDQISGTHSLARQAVLDQQREFVVEALCLPSAKSKGTISYLEQDIGRYKKHIRTLAKTVWFSKRRTTIYSVGGLGKQHTFSAVSCVSLFCLCVHRRRGYVYLSVIYAFWESGSSKIWNIWDTLKP